MDDLPVIAEDIAKRYRSGRGIENISLTVEPGQCLGVLGANGSGKTTLTRMVAGFDRIDRGRLLVLGENAYRRPAAIRSRCGIALDMPTHWNAVTGRQNLYFFAHQYGLTEPLLSRRVNQLLDEANLADQADEPAGDYSFGMRRKLSVIEALVADPDLLILDEASAGTDAAFLDQLTRWVERRGEKGQATWIADNDPDWLARTATHAILLTDGRIEARGDGCGGCAPPCRHRTRTPDSYRASSDPRHRRISMPRRPDHRRPGRGRQDPGRTTEMDSR